MRQLERKVWSQKGLIPANYMNAKYNTENLGDYTYIDAFDGSEQELTTKDLVGLDLPRIKHMNINTADIMNLMSGYADLCCELGMSEQEEFFRQAYIDMDLSDYDEAWLLACGIATSIYRGVKQFYITYSKNRGALYFYEYMQEKIYVSNKDLLNKNYSNLALLINNIYDQVKADNQYEMNMQFLGDKDEI